MKRSFVAGGRVLVIAGGVAVGLLSAVQQSDAQTITQGTIQVKLQSIGSINIATKGEPLDLAQPVGDSANGNRLFVATHGGQIRLIKNGVLQGTPYVDLTAAPISIGIQGGSGSDERGLIGFAFHPDFNVAGSPGFGHFYTYTSEPNVGTPTFTHSEFAPAGPGSIAYQNVLREWTVNPASDSFATNSSTVLFSVAKQQTNHNGGGIKFGPNNYLYLSLGDGGGGDDFSGGAGTMTTTDGHTNLTGNGQDTNVIYGKIVRINPLSPTETPGSSDPASGNGKYRIPANNPFVGTAGLDEVFIDGVRNPFRFSFDRANPNDLYIGDVGQTQREEVDLAHVNSITGSNNNYGWPFIEGTLDNSHYAQSGAGTVAPIGEYTHGDGISISGGFVYRGSLIPQLVGKYVFGDLGGAGGNTGRLFYMDAAGGTIRSLMIDPTGVQISGRLYSFGEDQSGELYTMWGNGNVIKLIPEPAGLTVVGLLLLPMIRRRARRS
ncbi:MAG TPA: PQQ-dependent sugar dehydrogenase [Tepidisphaeraceae bacterium]|jgi:glucose/arabinose dehydrogenase